MYAVGVLFNGDNYTYVRYGLYNDTENEKNIEDVYSRIFESIEEKEPFLKNQS